MKWLLLGAGIGLAWLGAGVLLATTLRIGHWISGHKHPAGGEPLSPGERSPRPGPPRLIPPPPVTHPGRLIRRVDLYRCAHGHYAWVWRGWDHGWQEEMGCPAVPSDREYEAFLASLPREDT